MEDRKARIERGRDLYARRSWTDAHAALTAADREDPLGAGDLELLGTAAYMLGRSDEHVHCLERAHEAHLAAEGPVDAARCAFWAGLNLALRGEVGRAAGWFGRARRLVDRAGRDCPERGYLLIPSLFQAYDAGESAAAYGIATEAADVAQRFDDRDLLAIAVHEQGHALLEQGRLEEGLHLLDEAMVMVTTGELSPMVTGLVYCSVLGFCQEVFAVRRAQEWTDAMREWCGRQPDLVAFTGRCLIHRAELLVLRGRWEDAIDEASRAQGRFARSRRAAAEASYWQGEVHRLRGELGNAERAYRDASRGGWDPQPGLAMLRLAEGKHDLALAGIRRVIAGRSEPRARAPLLPACVEILLATGDVDGAVDACGELERIAADHGRTTLESMASYARGAVELARGDPGAALSALRRAGRGWQELEAPYEVARTRMLTGRACRKLGDEDAAGLELDAARDAFTQLGAAPDAARVEALLTEAGSERPHGLTQRELEVLRLVAVGKSNRDIGEELRISEHTVARHLQNVFTKLDVSSRTAAATVAFRHGLF